jgi:hypothetical protein
MNFIWILDADVFDDLPKVDADVFDDLPKVDADDSCILSYSCVLKISIRESINNWIIN